MKTAEASTVLQSSNTYVPPKPINNVDESQTQNNDENAWSPAQQKQLEVALKSTDSTDPGRWEKVAKEVDGKNKKQCIQRYKHLVQMIKQNKEAK